MTDTTLAVVRADADARDDARMDIVDFAETYWKPPSLRGAAIRLEDHQKRILRHVLTPGGDGKLPYGTILWSEPKKSGKTEMLALIAFWTALIEPHGEIYLLANDMEQARSRAFTAMARCVRGVRGVKVLSDRIILSNGSIIQALPCDWAGSAGSNPSLSGWDELWGFSKESGRRLWDELTPSPARLNSIRVVVTYAGFTGESSLLEEMYHRGLEGKPVPELADIDNGDGQPACRVADGMFMYWSHRPRMPWQTPEYYERQRDAPGFRLSAYLRLHENRWQAPESSFVTPAEWEACRGFVKDLAIDQPQLVAGVDGALRHDSFAIEIVSRHPDPAKREIGVAVRASKIWKAERGRDIDFAGPFEWLKRFAQEHRLLKVVFDEWQLADWARRFQAEAGVFCEAFQQGPDRNRADSLLYELIASKRLLHDGDAELTAHVENAAFRVSGEQERGRLVKLAPSKKIDGCVALAMASYECLRLRL